jgi:hypothetical protein
MATQTVLSTMEKNKKEITELKQIISDQSSQIERNKQAICQLLGGLYSNPNQRRALGEYMSLLYGERMDPVEDDSDDDDEEEEEPDNMWPSTRQDSENEKRIKVMEAHFQQLEEQVAAMEKRQLEKFGLA